MNSACTHPAPKSSSSMQVGGLTSTKKIFYSKTKAASKASNAHTYVPILMRVKRAKCVPMRVDSIDGLEEQSLIITVSSKLQA